MVKISDKMIFSAKNLILVLLTIQITACTGQEYEDIVSDKFSVRNTKPTHLKIKTATGSSRTVVFYLKNQQIDS